MAQGIAIPQVWNKAGSNLSFGEFISQDQINLSGRTTDPNNADTDGDGMLDGIELLFTRWNQSMQVWTLNPLVPGDGYFDEDKDALVDRQELNLSTENPLNGGSAPPDAAKMWEEAMAIDPGAAASRLYNILFGKEGRALIALQQWSDWQNGAPAAPLLTTLMGITDPTQNDTDGDGMIDGFEYWFTEWDLQEGRWTMNPLTDTDKYTDSDSDSYDCDGNGIISLDEKFHNLAEYQSRIYGKEAERFSVPSEVVLINYAEDAIAAYSDEQGKSRAEALTELWSIFVNKEHPSNPFLSRNRMDGINFYDYDNYNKSLLGITDPTHPDSDQDGLPDGWEYCYSHYQQVLPLNYWRWSTNPVNPLDVDYDPDEDGWYDRQTQDRPATQGEWANREWSVGSSADQLSVGNSPLFFTNWMEYDNGTRPDSNDSDGDSVVMIHQPDPVVPNGTLSYYRDWNLTDGREVFKYQTNPMDNDTDGDMLPDWHEYKIGWNENFDNWSKFVQVAVNWSIINGAKKPLNQTPLGEIVRPVLEWVWATFNASDDSDAVQDPDHDGKYRRLGVGWEYVPYNNFQEFYGLANETLNSADAVRSTPLLFSGSQVTEWWQLRALLLGLGTVDEVESNYLRVNAINYTDNHYAWIVVDFDTDYLSIGDPKDDLYLCNGEWTDDWNSSFFGNKRLPQLAQGEYAWGWHLVDWDGDHIAEGTNPLNWDTDGDWLNDWFEIEHDLLDGIRGNGGSPLRYDDRSTF
jgi:hypothetical protein